MLSENINTLEKDKFVEHEGDTSVRFYGNIKGVEKAPYGEQLVAQPRPVITGNAIYNFIPANFRTFVDGTGSVVAEDQIFKISTGETVGSCGRPLGSFTIAKGQSTIVSLKDLNIRIPPTLNFVIAARMTSRSSADLTAALVWNEDI